MLNIIELDRFLEIFTDCKKGGAIMLGCLFFFICLPIINNSDEFGNSNQYNADRSNNCLN